MSLADVSHFVVRIEAHKADGSVVEVTRMVEGREVEFATSRLLTWVADNARCTLMREVTGRAMYEGQP